MRKCPPGVICIENITMGFTIIILLILIYVMYYYYYPQNKNNHRERQRERVREKEILIPLQPSLNYPYNNNYIPPLVPGNVLLNPYSPPLSDERYMIPSLTPGIIPINISTNVGSVDTSYRQVGILNPLNKPNKDNVLPLMGRPVFTNRDKWQYYTIGNQHNNIKLPISVKGKSGSNEYGVDKLYNGDTVYIEGLNDAYRATIYDNDTIKYLPFI
jgi:cbb3-type cytochrome oxidase subunit 3